MLSLYVTGVKFNSSFIIQKIMINMKVFNNLS